MINNHEVKPLYLHSMELFVRHICIILPPSETFHVVSDYSKVSDLIGLVNLTLQKEWEFQWEAFTSGISLATY